MSPQTLAAAVPHQLFFQTAQQRTALARQLFFDEGARPSGLVGEAVIQSWLRCTAAHASPSADVAFDPVTASRLHATLSRNRKLITAARQELDSLEATLASTGCRVLLTDAKGVLLHATHNPLASQQPVLKIACRVGVNIAESHVGTTAPGIVVKTGEACTVTGAEHFYDCLQGFECAAAPIHDIHGRLAAVLDLSTEARSFGFDAASVVGLYATSIENRLLQAQSSDHLVLSFQANPALLDTPLEALAGVTSDGTVAWLNGVATRLTGSRGEAPPQRVESLFHLSLQQVLQWVRAPEPRAARLPNGLGVWVRARLQACDGVDFKHAAAVAPVRLAPVQPPPPGPALAPANTAASPGAAPPACGWRHRPAPPRRARRRAGWRRAARARRARAAA